MNARESIGQPSRGGFAPDFDELDAALIDSLHDGFPLCDRPYEAIGRALGIGEDEALRRLQRLLDSGVLTRLGPLYQIERAGGAYLLVALPVPEDRFEAVAALVNAHPEVAHNYRRDHALNMWFVAAAASQDAVDDCVAAIQRETGIAAYAFPKQREFRVELRLSARRAFGGEAK